MSELAKAIFIYVIAVIAVFVLKNNICRISNKAIKKKKLTNGIYAFFPVEGRKAIDIAKGYIRGVNIVFWFIVIIFPIIIVFSLLRGYL